MGFFNTIKQVGKNMYDTIVTVGKKAPEAIYNGLQIAKTIGKRVNDAIEGAQRAWTGIKAIPVIGSVIRTSGIAGTVDAWIDKADNIIDTANDIVGGVDKAYGSVYKPHSKVINPQTYPMELNGF